MADSKITALTSISTSTDPANDPLVIVDVSDTSMAATGTTKKVTLNQLLGASGTATLASATITGNLTLTGGTANGIPYLNASKVVTTSDKLSFAQTGGFFSTTFNINSLIGAANYKAGIVVTEDDNSFTLYGGSGYKLIDAFGYSTPNQLRFYASNVEQYRIDASGVFNWYDGAGGTRMTLNSTGLGVGASPTSKLTIGTAAYAAGTLSGTSSLYSTVAQGLCVLADGFNIFTRTGGDRFVLDSSGNVGIGVTPSAWTTSYNALNIGSGGSITAYKSANYDQFYIGSNFFENTSGAWRFINNGYATQYWHNSGSHVWRTSTTSNAAGANQPLTWTSAMTLESTGSLVLGAAAVATTATDGFLYIPGCAGTPTGTPTAKTGRVPLVVDTTNNKLYFYSGGAWVAAN